MTTEKLAIVGSTGLAGNADAERIIRELFDRYQPAKLVSGGAVGIDTMAAEEAKRRGIPASIFLPEVRRWDGGGTAIGFKQRNELIARACTRLARIVVRNSKTYGSGWTRDLAAKLGKPTEEYVIDVEAPHDNR